MKFNDTTVVNISENYMIRQGFAFNAHQVLPLKIFLESNPNRPRYYVRKFKLYLDIISHNQQINSLGCMERLYRFIPWKDLEPGLKIVGRDVGPSHVVVEIKLYGEIDPKTLLNSL